MDEAGRKPFGGMIEEASLVNTANFQLRSIKIAEMATKIVFLSWQTPLFFLANSIFSWQTPLGLSQRKLPQQSCGKNLLKIAMGVISWQSLEGVGPKLSELHVAKVGPGAGRK